MSKTLRMGLIPIAETESNFEKKMLLASDTERKERYEQVKKLIDRYHKHYIDMVLSKVIELDGFDEYVQLYFDPSADKVDALKKLEEKLRKCIAKKLSETTTFKEMFKKDMVTNLLPDFLTDPEELEITNSFAKFTTYFTGFFENRKNMYTDKEQATGIAYRCINDNLPKFLDNVKSFETISEKLSESALEQLNSDFSGLNGTTVFDAFTADYFIYVLSQSGIDSYNNIIGGYATEDGRKVQGLNEYINLYNQISGNDRLPQMKPLFKQILSDRQTESFIPKSFDSDNEVITAVRNTYLTDCPEDDFVSLKKIIAEISALFARFNSFDLSGVFIKNGLPVTDLSNGVCGSWSELRELWNRDYDAKLMPAKVKDQVKYEEKRTKAYKANGSFSIAFLQGLISSSDDPQIRTKSIAEYLSAKVSELTDKIAEAYSKAENLLHSDYESRNRSLKNDDASVALIKNFLDAIKELEKFIKPLCGTGKEFDKNELFYGEFSPLYSGLCSVDGLYNMVRNYVTQKPYSTDKIKLNFENCQFMNGWDRNKERDYLSVLFIRDDKYYLGIMDKDNNKVFESYPKPTDGEECYHKMVYKLLPGPNKMLPKVFFSKSNFEFFAPSAEIMRIYKGETFKKNDKFCLGDCHKLIDFYKESLAKHPDWTVFGFKFRPTKEYADISEFYKDVHDQGYKVTFADVPVSYVDSLVQNGKLFLFQIYNKDFSAYSKGTKNLHTLYFQMLFDERNLSDVVYQLNGGAEMFYRPASIAEKDRTIHHANQPIDKKSEENSGEYSMFGYDLIKDRRFTKPQFLLHFPITLNFKAPDARYLNDRVRELIKQSDSNYVIGIDRGERNLLYITVLDGDGNIVEQYSLNLIQNEYNGKKHTVDYHFLLDDKEEKLKAARQNWTMIENIKELKAGYISQAVHKICSLVVKYDAIIVMEDLNAGFKHSRAKIGKQVYQKFEKMLIDKLNFYADKHIPPQEIGGLLNAYQLTNKFESFSKMGFQNGIIFYVPAWLTSKIDPVTGFANLFKLSLTNKENMVEFISKFRSICYNAQKDYFEFSFNYHDFGGRAKNDFRKLWTVCTYGKRVREFRNPDNNNQWDSEIVDPTERIKALLTKYGVDFSSKTLKDDILKVDRSDFFTELLYQFKLTVQLRNSVANSTAPEDDYIISPVADKNGVFYDSRNYDQNSSLPCDADANGAYNIARKGLWAIEQIKAADDISKVRFSIKQKEWLKLVQSSEK